MYYLNILNIQTLFLLLGNVLIGSTYAVNYVPTNTFPSSKKSIQRVNINKDSNIVNL